jgi:hypothetical protein
MGNNRLKNFSIAAFFLAVITVMFSGALEPGKMLLGNDTITIYMAFAVFAKKMMLLYHSLPAWLPDICLGMPMIGSSSLLYYYPTDLIFMLLPFPIQYMYVPDMIIHMFIAALGMYLFLKKLKLSREASLFGAAALMISGYMISYIFAGHWNNIKAGALIPFAFYFIHRALEEKKLIHYLNTALVFALQMLATGMQIMAYTYIGVVFYAGYRIIFVEKDGATRARTCLLFALSTVCILLFSAPQFVPSIFYTNHSWRGGISYENFVSWSFHPAETITFLLPRFYGLFGDTYYGHMMFNLTTYYFGVIPLLLLFFLPFSGRYKKTVIFFAAASAVFIVLAFGGYTFFYGIFYYIPVFKQFRNPSRFLYLATFFIITLSSVGLNNLLETGNEESKIRSLKRAGIIIGGILAILLLATVSGGIGSFVSSSYARVKNQQIQPGLLYGIKDMINRDMVGLLFITIGFGAIVLLFIKRRIKSAFIAVLLLACVNFLDVQRIDSKFIMFDYYSRYIPENNEVVSALRTYKQPFRVQNFDALYGMNRNIYYGVENLTGMHGLMPADYENMMLKKSFDSVMVDRVFNIKYFLNGQELKIPGFVKILEGQKKLYRDTYAKDRVYFSDNIIKKDSREEMLDFMGSAAFNSDQAVVGRDFPADPHKPGNGTAAIKEYRPDRVLASVESGTGGVVVHSAGYFSEWKAKVDGKEEKTYRVNYLAMGVPVGPGIHEVEFYYDKTEIYAGIIIGAVSFLAYIGILFYTRKRRK